MVFQRSLLPFKLHCRRYDLGDDNSPSYVQFTIHSASKHQKTRFRSSDGEVLDDIEFPITGSVAQVDQPPLTYDTTYLIIRDMLSILDIDSRQRDGLIGEIINEAADIINMDSHLGHKLWVVSVEIKIITMIYVKERELIRDSDEMGPATRSSIAALEQVKFDNAGDCSESCVICLEELPKGTHVSRMPCSHVFHANCIFKWLNKSHCCPICRFKMLT